MKPAIALSALALLSGLASAFSAPQADLPPSGEPGPKTNSFIAALSSEGPAPEIADKMMLYGRFVGAWEGRSLYHARDGKTSEESCEVHFGWALDGRAVQDVWIAPARKHRGPGAAYSMYGTTLRIYDPKSDRWQITWIDPSHQGFDHMTGRQEGADIIQEYHSPDGMLCQWCFTEITENSFHWIGRGSTDNGQTWFVESEYLLHRVTAAPER